MSKDIGTEATEQDQKLALRRLLFRFRNQARVLLSIPPIDPEIFEKLLKAEQTLHTARKEAGLEIARAGRKNCSPAFSVGLNEVIRQEYEAALARYKEAKKLGSKFPRGMRRKL